MNHNSYIYGLGNTFTQTISYNGMQLQLKRAISETEVQTILRELPLIEAVYESTLCRKLNKKEAEDYCWYIMDKITALYTDKTWLKNALISTPEFQKNLSGANGIDLQNCARRVMGLSEIIKETPTTPTNTPPPAPLPVVPVVSPNAPVQQPATAVPPSYNQVIPQAATILKEAATNVSNLIDATPIKIPNQSQTEQPTCNVNWGWIAVAFIAGAIIL